MSRHVLLIDNYDSFVYNLARYFAELECTPVVVRNDALTVSEIAAMDVAALVISPGPKAPRDAGICVDAIRQLGDRIPILGVCLGHQAIAEACGGEVVRAPQPRHGETSPVYHTGEGLFSNLPLPFHAARYHSLIARSETLPDALRVTAWTDDGLVMGLAHTRFPMFGVQFHPESILTECGHRLLANFLRTAGIPCGPLPQEERVTLPATPAPGDAWWQADPF